ncbi:acylphosphatase [Patescibacteria group bacterium]|nr:acylphosphatase [Patescibacteria group bacterium]MBU1922501.1 acylphosphatase [Patescibacteria group bacterium]
MIAQFAKLSGRVQGVKFRFTTMLAAKYFKVFGNVKNTADGGVEIFAQGEPDRVEKFMDWAKHGPPWANVRGFEMRAQEPRPEIKDFKVQH